MPENQALPVQPLQWRDGHLRVLDQTRLPHDVHYFDTDDYRVVADAIVRLAVRGAPLIGIAAAYGMALASLKGEDLQHAAEELIATRPTAVNLRWAIERVLAHSGHDAGTAVREAQAIHDEQVTADTRMGETGAELLPDDAMVLTHCNTGALATGGIGTALGVIKTAHRQGKRVRVLVDETRPLVQGARLTAWELQREGIPYRVIVDGAAAGLIARGDVRAVLVGADRIAANGDTANKVGTYGLALAAAAHGVPFYVVAPLSTIDTATSDGSRIKIEERGEDEVLSVGSERTAPEGSAALNPAFDVTLATLISAIVTERAVLRAPYTESIAAMTAAVVGR